MATIERLERDVHSAMQAVRALSDRGKDTLSAIEHDLWHALLGVGRAIIALYLAKQAARPRPPQYVHDGFAYTLDVHSRRKNEIGTRFGMVIFCRPIGRAVGMRHRADLPVDRELGLCSAFSLGTVTTVVQLCALMAFASARARCSRSSAAGHRVHSACRIVSSRALS